ncbi:unnamed protein product [Leuciscus chuanchicus]
MVAVRQQASERFKGCRRDIFQQNAPPSPATAPIMRRGTVNSRFSCSLAKPHSLIRSVSFSFSLPNGSQFPTLTKRETYQIFCLDAETVAAIV